jgi:hypothetical protein
MDAMNNLSPAAAASAAPGGISDEARASCQKALAAYAKSDAELSGWGLSPLGDGLINETYLVEPLPGAAPPFFRSRAVLQRVSPIFGRAVHADIEAVTAHLAARGLCTPRLYRTRDGELSVALADGGVYRLMSFIPGRTYAVMTPVLARPAGALVGRFHAALADLKHDFHFVRRGAHDLIGHLERLRQAVATAQRPDFAPPEASVPPAFFGLAETLLGHAATLPVGPVPDSLPLRLCHGDLKLNNLRFDDRDEGLCLLDLDTLAYLPLCFELGDALRSWCNPRGEDSPDAAFDLGLFEEALVGYAGPMRPLLLPAERGSLVYGVLRITLQLAVRFAVDVVQQSYFRWDRRRFASRAAHNLQRATGQLRLFESLLAIRPRAEAILSHVFCP